MVWPSRSIVIASAPTTRASQGQSARSFLTLMLWVMVWPQKTNPGTGADPTSQEYFAGERSMFPALSTEWTRNSRAPTDTSVYSFGEMHGTNASCPGVFSEHSNVASGSSLENVNVAFVRTVVWSGPDSIDVSGGVVSLGGSTTSHMREAGVGSALPFRSIARTSKVCEPTLRPGY